MGIARNTPPVLELADGAVLASRWFCPRKGTGHGG